MQLGGAASLGRRFSYCLVPHSVNTSSALNFGALANVTEPGAASTPLVAGDVDTYYTVVLDSVKVGNKTVASAASSRIIVDSGDAMREFRILTNSQLARIEYELLILNDLVCTANRKQTEQASPDLTLEFGGGAEAGERVRDGAAEDAVPGDRGDNGAAAGRVGLHVTDPAPPCGVRSRPIPSFASQIPPAAAAVFASFIISLLRRLLPSSLPNPPFQKRETKFLGEEEKNPAMESKAEALAAAAAAAAAAASAASTGGGHACGGWETPKREECRIPATLPCPAAPRKAVPDFGKRRGPPKNGYFQPPDLEALFALAPRRQASSCA
uniref:Peptidase A1 domain-containing protein n=1 Tax=Oryza glaberrima TaxID=4538 RepID=I1NT91_ORYGL